MSDLYLHRPEWLLAFIPLLWLLWRLKQRRSKSQEWEQQVDSHLLPHISTPIGQQQQRSLLLPLAFVWSIVIIILAGPSWQKVPPVTLQNQLPPLIVVLDLSRSMLTRDIYPDRLQVAQSKTRRLLEQLPPRSLSLLVYSAMAHQVVPLTEDRSLIINLLEYLHPELMPAQGSRPTAAIERLNQLLANDTYPEAHILLITDGISTELMQSGEDAGGVLNRLLNSGGKIIVYGVGTPNGAYIPEAERGYLQVQGQPVHSQLQRRNLQNFAQQAAGEYIEVTADDADIVAMSALLEQWSAWEKKGIKASKPHKTAQVWQDQAVWLLVIILPLVWRLFQPRLYSVLLAIAMGSQLLFYGVPSQAEPIPMLENPQAKPDQSMHWESWWKNRQQRGWSALMQQDYDEAQRLFEDPMWQGIIAYRQKNYQQALSHFSQVIDTFAGGDPYLIPFGRKTEESQRMAQFFYNRANTLVQLRRYEQALTDYRFAYKIDPRLKQAIQNYILLRQTLNDAQKAENDSALKSPLQKPPKKPVDKPSEKKPSQQNPQPMPEIPEMAEGLMDKPTELDLQSKKDHSDLGLETLGSQSGGAMLVHDIDKEQNHQGASIGQGMGEGTQALQQQDQIARQGQPQPSESSPHEAQRIIENKSVDKPSQAKMATTEKEKETEAENKEGIQSNPNAVQASHAKAEPQKQSKQETPQQAQQKSDTQGGSGINAQSGQQAEQQQFLHHWLKSIEDNPSELLKEIFKREYENRLQQPLHQESISESEVLDPW